MAVLYDIRAAGLFFRCSGSFNANVELGGNSTAMISAEFLESIKFEFTDNVTIDLSLFGHVGVGGMDSNFLHPKSITTLSVELDGNPFFLQRVVSLTVLTSK